MKANPLQPPRSSPKCMNSSENSFQSSRFANGQTIRELRCRLGMTQLGLAMKIDCSERLIRKMEKSQRVSLRSLSLLKDFLGTQQIHVTFNNLCFSPKSPLVVAQQWFRERFVERMKEADQKWFSEEITLSKSTLIKLEVLEKTTKSVGISAGAALHQELDVTINFHLNLEGDLAQEPSGSVWLRAESGKIVQLNLILDSKIQWTEL